jgi:phage shock protein A
MALVIKAQVELIDQQNHTIEQLKAVVERQHQDLAKMEALVNSIVVREQVADAFKKHYGLN